MWNVIEKTISENIQSSFSIQHKQIIPGGDINQHFVISNGTQQYFVKLNTLDAYQNFESEAFNLSVLQKHSSIPCTQVVALGTTITHAFIVLNYLNFSSPLPHHWFELGKQLAQMHKDTQHGQFGWEFDNYIGKTIQPNPWMSNWRTFFSEQRIGWQLQLLQEKSIKIGDIDHITSVCHDALLHHNPTPCLVHGDLWQGNIGFSQNQPLIFDPACYYGDSEVDVAMTELFGSFPHEFYEGYNTINPIEKHYEQRKFIYNFYHILNHANIFGSVYIEQAKAMLKRIMSTHIYH